MTQRLSHYFGIILCSSLLACGATETPEDHSFDRVELAGGCFQMGEARVYPEERPVREVCVERFAIMPHEVTEAQFARFVAETGYKTRAERGWRASEPGGPGIDLPPSSAVFSPEPGVSPRALNWWKLVEGANWRKPLGPGAALSTREDVPVVHVTRDDAEAFASWAGGRLPTEAEWEFAARGGEESQLMAWGDAEKSAIREKANTWTGIFPVSNTASDGFEGLAPVGLFPPNGFGLYDMIGNVWEWTSTPYAPNHSEAARQRAGQSGLDPTQPGVAVGTIRGGSYLCARSYCYRFRPAARQAQDLAFGTSHIGFRIVWSSESKPQ